MCRFVYAVQKASDLPIAELPEVAFVGRSNVGKSSLINALTRRNSLARTSRTPGRTKQIIFFNLANRLMLVDLPGYGFARQSKTTIAAWTELMWTYLATRNSLRRVCLLIDGRHGLKPNDLEMLKMFTHTGVSFIPILTKCDKITTKECENILSTTRTHLHTYPTVVCQPLVTSTVTGNGFPALRAHLSQLTT